LNYIRQAIAINRRPVTSRAPLQAPHNASCVFTERANKSAYHLHTNINCGDTAPTKEDKEKSPQKADIYTLNYSKGELFLK
jgi:hypothetical protein